MQRRLFALGLVVALLLAASSTVLAGIPALPSSFWGTVKVDGDIRSLWQNWTHGLHRQTVYGDISRELGWFCRFNDIELIDEARL